MYKVPLTIKNYTPSHPVLGVRLETPDQYGSRASPRLVPAVLPGGAPDRRFLVPPLQEAVARRRFLRLPPLQAQGGRREGVGDEGGRRRSPQEAAQTAEVGGGGVVATHHAVELALGEALRGAVLKEGEEDVSFGVGMENSFRLSKKSVSY